MAEEVEEEEYFYSPINVSKSNYVINNARSAARSDGRLYRGSESASTPRRVSSIMLERMLEFPPADLESI